jgi:hypothetical protein
MKHYIDSFKLFENKYQEYADMAELGLAAATPDRQIDAHRPDDKDWLRARNLIDSANPVSKSVSMSKLITDRAKLVRRAKAVAATLKRFRPDLIGPVFEPFAKRMAEMGFTENQIYWTLETRWRF